jgi:hypothetical protein
VEQCDVEPPLARAAALERALTAAVPLNLPLQLDLAAVSFDIADGAARRGV